MWGEALTWSPCLPGPGLCSGKKLRRWLYAEGCQWECSSTEPLAGLCTLLSEGLWTQSDVCSRALWGQEGISPHGCWAFRQPHEHSITLHAHPWAARGPLSLLLWLRESSGCESVCVAKRINTLLLCPINLSSAGGWLYPPALQFNGFRSQ